MADGEINTHTVKAGKQVLKQMGEGRKNIEKWKERQRN